jgi:putative spermidine/putrescine transport system permease protein
MSTVMTPDAATGMDPHRRARRPSGRAGRWIILAIAAVYFIGPLIAAISFTVQNPRGGLTLNAYQRIFTISNGQTGLGGALLYSFEIAIATIVITLALMLPTQLLLHLRLPRWRGLVEVITLLPLVFPPVVLVVGVSDVYSAAAPNAAAAAGADQGVVFDILRWIRDGGHPLLLALLYVVLALPFVYRALDTGIRSVDVRTLVEASRSLGAGWGSVLLRVLAPSLRTAIVNAGFLCFALVMGEYTISSILLYTKPFPVWLVELPTNDGQVQAAVSVFSLLIVELILLVVSIFGQGKERSTR